MIDMNKRQVNPGDWVKVTDKFVNKSFKGRFYEIDFEVGGWCLRMDSGRLQVFKFTQYDIDFLHRDWQEVNHEGVVCRVESEDGFVTFEVRKTENVYDLYMILGYDGKMLLKEFTDLEEAKEYAEKIIDSMKHIS
jgi:hypothetical protein